MRRNTIVFFTWTFQTETSSSGDWMWSLNSSLIWYAFKLISVVMQKRKSLSTALEKTLLTILVKGNFYKCTAQDKFFFGMKAGEMTIFAIFVSVYQSFFLYDSILSLHLLFHPLCDFYSLLLLLYFLPLFP